MKNRIISETKSIIYGITEPIKLRFSREPCLKADPLVSVYIPTHNRRDLLLERSLKSVLAQTYKKLEIVVVAHGCTDGTNKAVMRHFFTDGRIKFISIPREEAYPPILENHWFTGRVVPSNVGLKHCTGDWVATIDDDDSYLPDAIESLLRFAQTYGYEFVSGGSENQSGPIPPYKRGNVKIGGISTWLYRSYLKSFKFNPDCWRKNWNKVCDVDLQDRFFKAGVEMGYLDKIVTKILPRPGDNVVGLAAARQNREGYLRHLAFK